MLKTDEGIEKDSRSTIRGREKHKEKEW